MVGMVSVVRRASPGGGGMMEEGRGKAGREAMGDMSTWGPWGAELAGGGEVDILEVVRVVITLGGLEGEREGMSKESEEMRERGTKKNRDGEAGG